MKARLLNTTLINSMKKGKLIILLLSLLFLSSGAKATHIMGGEITWQCLTSGASQGDYIFTMKIYRDCNGIALTNNAQISVWGSTTINNFNLNLISNTDISPNGNAANSGTACLDCAAGNAGAVEEYIYRSAPITLLGIPPINGWHFTWDSCCRNIAVSNIITPNTIGFTLRASMFPFTDNSGIILPADPCFDSSPVFSEKPQTIICTGYPFTYSHNASDPEFDGLSYHWDAPLNAFIGNYNPPINPPAIIFSPPYTFNSPLPGAPNLSTVNGEISFSPNIAGNFVSLVRVDAWKCGQRVASIYRENQIVTLNCPSLSGSTPNSPPVITAPTNSPQSWTTTTNSAGLPSYETTVNAGELVEFNISAQDLDLYSNGASQVVTLEISGGQIAPCNNPPCASFVNASGGGLPPFTSPTLVEGVFEWNAVCTNSSVCGITSNQFTFLIKAYDDFCPANAITISTITINVNSLSFSNLPTFCDDGDTTDLTAYLNNLLGTPVIFSSNTGAITSSGIFTSNAGNHIITVMMLNGACSDTLTDTINIPTFTVGLPGLFSPICEGSPSLYLGNYANVMWAGTDVTNLSSISYSCSTPGIIGQGSFLNFNTIGSYYINITATYNGCSISDSVLITIIPNPIVNIIGDSIICVGDTATLTANSSLTWGVTYNWSNGANTPTITVIPTTTTSYSVTVTSLYGCVGTDTFTVNVTPAPNFNINYGDVYCEGDSIIVIPSYIDSNCHLFSWTDFDGNIISTDSFMIYFNGIYTLSVTDTITGCTSDTTFNTLDFLPSVNIQGLMSFCHQDTLILYDTLTNNYTYLWSTGSTDTSIAITLGDTTYSLTVTDTLTGCSSTDKVFINAPSANYYIFPKIHPELDTVMCAGDSVELVVLDTLTNVVPPNTYTVLWNTGASTNSIFAGITGTYWAAVTDLNGCTDTAFIDITVHPLPSVSITSNAIMGSCEDSVLLIAIADTSNSFYWFSYSTPPNAMGNLFNYNNSLWVSTSGSYIALVIDSNGCTATDTITISFDPACCKVPNADYTFTNGENSSDLIAMNGSGSVIDNKIILIQGTFNIDEAIELKDCEVIMGANAMIWYTNLAYAATLTLNNTHIHACADTMWQGIFVNTRNITVKNGSIIEDAIEAIVINLPGVAGSNDANFRIENSFFRNNIYSLVAYPMLEVNNSIFVGNTISNDKRLLYNQINGVQVDSSFVGILLNQTNNLVIGNGTNSLYQNTIRDLRYGIVGLQTSFEVYNTHFENIHLDHSTGTSFPSFINPTACIYADGIMGLPGDILKVGSSVTRGNSFNNFDLGVYAERMNSTITNNTFTQGQWAGIGASITANRVTMINENQLTNVIVGVWVTGNDNGDMTIDNNSFSTNTAIGGISSTIGVYGGNFSAAVANNFRVSNNCFDEVFFQGIKLTNVNYLYAYENYIRHSSYGLELNYCNFATVSNNSVVGDGQTNQMGIKISDSDFPRIGCNYSGYYKESMHFDGQMNADLRSNTIKFSDFGIVIDNAGSIGQQGTPSNPLDNMWIGNFGQIVGGLQTTPHIYTKGLSVGPHDPFLTRNFPPYDPFFSDFEIFPLSIAVPVFPANNSASYNFCAPFPNCSSAPLPIAPPSPSSKNPDLAAMETVALSDVSLTSAEEVYNNQERLYQEIKNDTTLINSSSILATFVNAKAIEDMGRIVRVKEKINEELYTQAQAIIDSMQATTNQELNAETVYEEILAPYLRGEDITKLTTSELANIRTIAYLCPHTDGLVVYTARVICRYYDNYWIDYANICERTVALVPQPRLGEEESELFKIYPNPAQEVVNIESNVGGTLVITNSLGQMIAIHKIEEGQTMEVAVNKLQSGLYFCKFLDVKGNHILTKKLDIIR
ncbi:MAG: hypothetical protein ACI93N_000021 [Flavobacteriaceae bacterium]|jgi:hypothetical protein